MAELNREIKRFRFRRRLDIDSGEKHLCGRVITEHTQAEAPLRVLQGDVRPRRPRERTGRLRPDRNNEEKKKRKGKKKEAGRKKEKRREDRKMKRKRLARERERRERPEHLEVPRGGVPAAALDFREQRPLNGRIKNSNGERE